MKKTRYVILGLLQEEPLSGYEIKKLISIRMSFFWQESYGQIYPELAKLKREGLIEQVTIEAEQQRLHDYNSLPDQSGDREGAARNEKIRYRITPEGHKALKQWMEAENETDTARSEFLLKMYFAGEENRSEMRHHLMQFKEEADKKVMLFTMFQAELSMLTEDHSNHKQILKVLDLGLRQAKLYASWSAEMLQDLE